MVEANHEFGKADSKYYPLNVTKSLPQRMGSIVPLKIDGCAPLLDQTIHGGNREDSALAGKKKSVVLERPYGQEFLYSIGTGFVKSDLPWFSRLLFL